MRLTRRNALIGLGTVAAGAGVVGGSGAFTSVTAERTVSVSTTGDGGAALQLAPASSSSDTNAGVYVNAPEDGVVSINLSNGNSEGVNQDAKTTIDELITVTNNGAEDLSELRLNMLVSGAPQVNPDNVFKFTASGSSAGGNSPYSNDSDISGGDFDSGSSLTFGIIIDLLPDDENPPTSSSPNDLPSDGTYTLEIEANSN